MKFSQKPRAEKSEGPTVYLRLKDGEAVNIIPRGEIYEFYSVFGVKGEATADTLGAKLRYKMNVIVNDGGTLKAKILEFGATIYDQLAEINKVYDVTQTKIRLSRKGSGKSDTMYMLLPVVNEPIGPKVLSTIETIPLHILDKGRPPQSHNGGFDPAPEDDFGPPPPDTGPDELPF